MFKNYLLSSLRNLYKNKFYTLINIAGLTAGLTVGILILLWVQDELSFDKFHKNSKQIVKIFANMGPADHKEIWGTQAPLAKSIREQFPEIKSSVRLVDNYKYTLFNSGHQNFIEKKGGFADSSFFSVFDFNLTKGNSKQVFSSPYSVVLSESAAKKYFGDGDAIGQIITADKSVKLTVTGIMKDSPANSSIQYDLLMPMSLHNLNFAANGGNGNIKTIDLDWGDFYYNTYFLLSDKSGYKDLQTKINQSKEQHNPGVDLSYILQPFATLHLENADGTTPRLKIVQIFIAVAFFILLIACINYVNLATARSMLRNKEVSVRKIVGAGKSQLFLQFVLETTILFVIAVALSLLAIYLLMPAYNSLTDKNLSFSFGNTQVWTLIGLTILVTLFASSIYPAILLSSFKPMSAMKGVLFSGMGNTSFRKVLVIVQFVFSIVLIAGTILISNQLDYIHKQELGYDKEYVFGFSLRDEAVPHLATIKTELLKNPAIKMVTTASGNILQSNGSTGDVDWDGKTSKQAITVAVMSIDKEFIPDMKLKLVSGENFNGTKTDSTHFILNEAMVHTIGMKNPVGKRFKLWQTNGTIVGVAKDYHFESMKEKIKPAIFFSDLQKNYYVYVKTTAKDAPEAIQAAKNIWKSYSPDFPFDYTFLDNTYDQLYKSDTRTGTLFSVFAGVAILISCLGLFALAAFTAQIKTKEIGIRKVLGSSVSGIVTLLSADFLKLVLISVLIATPISWLLMKSWLDDFAYHIKITWWFFAASGLGAVVIALLTVSYQTIKAARVNPVKSLRTE